MFFEGCDFWCLARRLPAYNGALFGSCSVVSDGTGTSMSWTWEGFLSHTWPVHRNDLVNRSGLHIVDDVVACSRHEMAIRKQCNVLLFNTQHGVQ
jgi:hypothetical protein